MKEYIEQQTKANQGQSVNFLLSTLTSEDDVKSEVALGQLIESDVHTLFDQGYVTVTPNFEVRVSSRLRDEFHNGKHYYRFEGRAIWLPKTEAERPNREFLEWHGDSVFRG